MEDELNILANGRPLDILENGRRPQYVEKWKTTPIFCQIEDNINFGK